MCVCVCVCVFVCVSVCVSVYLQLSQGVVTLLLARGLLGAQGDQLVDAVCHRSAERDI